MAKNKQQVDIGQSQVTDIEHAKLVRWVNDADDMTLGSRESSEKCRRYYDSEQWTLDEVKKLNKQKQAATVINRIKPKMDALMGMEKAAKTTAKAYPRTPKHEGGAEAATEAIRFVLQDNDFDQKRSACWENLLIEGSCGCEVIVKPNKQEGYKIIINHLMWDRLIYDPHSRRKDFSDARYLGQVVWMDYDEAVAEHPGAEAVLETMQNGSSTYDDQPRWMDNTRRRVKIVEMYYRKANGEMWYACFTRGGYCEEPKISPYIDEEENTEWPYEFASNFVTRSGGRYGAVYQLLDVQDEINKRRSKALHLMSVRQVRWERGAVDDINKARQELAKPDGVIETTPGMEFEVLKTGDMAQAQFNLLTEAKMEIDAVGANAAVQGKQSGVQSGVALRQRQQAGQTEVGPMFDVLKYWQYRVFKKVWNRVKQYWKGEMWIRVTDDEHNLRWVGLNKPITQGQQALEQAQSQGMPPEQLQQLAQQIAQDPASKKIVDTKNDIAEMDIDIVLSDVPDVLTAQIEDFQTLGEMVKSGFQIPPIAVIEASPLSNKDKIIKMMQANPPIPPQVQKQMEEMQKKLEETGKQAQQLAQENQQLKADTQTTAMKIQANAAESQAKNTAKQQEVAMELKLTAATSQAQLDLERAKALSQMQLEQEKAANQIRLEMMKEQAANDTALRKAALDAAVKIEVARISASKDAAEGQTPQAGTDTTQIMQQILDTQTKLLAEHGKPKRHTITLQKKDGVTIGADVAVN